MSQELLETIKQIKGIDVSKIQELIEIHTERQKAMIELSAILGQDVSFTENEILQNIADHYANEVLKDVEKKLLGVFSNG